MFNKSILVALILCACYLGAIQAGNLPLTPALLTGISAVDTAQQLTQGLPIGGGSGSGLPSLPIVGKPAIPIINS